MPSVSVSRRWRDRALMAGLVALVGVGLAGLASVTGWEESLTQIARLHPGQIAVLLALSLLNYLLRGLRWHLLARRLGLPTRLMQDLRHYIGGFALSVTPGRLGEFVRMRWIRRETGWPVALSAPLALMDRATDLAVMGLLLALSLALAAGGLTGALPVTAFAFATAVVATRPRLLAALVTLGYRVFGRLPRLFGRARQAARALSRFHHAPTLAFALTLGFAGWLAEGYAFHLLLGFLGAEIGLWKAVAIFIFATLAGGLTGAPGGMGGAEAAMLTLLTLEGVALEIALPATAVIRLTTLWFSIALGLLVFPLAERAAAGPAR
ncbi:uncharacterized protein (TIRG00374 family) [Rhodobacter maris]|uniref:Uncharacterized protein (TIRG00374 family) n=2 Tax=Rhodobacter maris TaxID=446682 RepID=A0A285S4Q5_9RHOB|nr:uncharacterized protein (TIRG00374 family) [Rhodobacter maris]